MLPHIHAGECLQSKQSCRCLMHLCLCAVSTPKAVALGGALLPASEPHFAASRVQSVKPGPLWGAFK